MEHGQARRRIRLLVGMYAGWIVLHYVASHAYAELCVPMSIRGIAISPFLIATPHCTALRWCIGEGASIVSSMWVQFGTVVAAWLVI